MKTLLLALVVVAIVYLELFCDNVKKCAKGQKVCYINYIYSDIPKMEVIKGCAASCPTEGDYERVLCCPTDNCI
ncbi:toxin 3FTx-Thr5-like [Protobothrops mucrosquamatus]|uniref:toxin 3FTx-Thr5-like n=1 Tax=Protobothrops mucrosquamatus TaxID=103944 RepID=UPI000775F12E|nr:toxin 3FTx-Thr5-like [Protobothrops mucrosquamatus]